MPQHTADLDICVHATGPYLTYAEKLAQSIEAHWGEQQTIRLIVFTDRPEVVEGWVETPRLSLLGVMVPHRSWPDATIRRYEDYARHGSLLTAPIVMFLDADMLVVDRLPAELAADAWVAGVAVVRHPGFYRADPAPLSDEGGYGSGSSTPALGSWETRSNSLSYVEPERRKFYVCGGVWMGRRASALALCAELAVRIEVDSQRGVTAVWHDESHLNWWFAQYGPTLLDPDWCYVDGYAHLSHLSPRVVALDKPTDFVESVKGLP